MLILCVILLIGSASATDYSNNTEEKVSEDSTITPNIVSAEKSIKTGTNEKIITKNVETRSKNASNTNTKENSVISTNPIKTVAFLENFTVTGKLTDKNNNPINNNRLSISYDGKDFTTNTDSLGLINFSTRATKVGQNNLTISFKGNNLYNPISKNLKFTVTKQSIILTVDKIKLDGDNLLIEGTFTDSQKNPLADSNVRVAVNDEAVLVKTNSKGVYVYSENVELDETNTLNVSYYGNEYYYKNETFITFENPDIRLSDSVINPGVEKNFLALVPYDGEGDYVFKINQKSISGKLKASYGILTYKYVIPESFKSETYELELVYSGDEKYIEKTVKATLTLTPVGGRVYSNITLKNVTQKYSTTEEISVKLNDDAFGTVVFRVNSNNISSTIKVVDGRATFSYKANLKPGTYNLSVIYNGNYKYNPSEANARLIIEKLKTTIKTTDTKDKAGSTTIFKATITDELGNPVNNKKVTFRMNGDKIGTNNTDDKGVVKLYYKLKSTLYEKTYNITYTLDATDTLYGSTNSSTLTLLQLKTMVIFPTISTKPSKTVVMTATVVDEFNNYVTKGYVRFKKGRETLGAVPVSNGFAKFTLKTNYETTSKVQTYGIYVGDWKYANSEGKGTFEVTKIKTSTSITSVDAKPNSVITLKALVRDKNQNYATDGSVKFTVNNKVVGTSNVKNGIATMKYNLNNFAAGKYRIKAEYSGSKIYVGSNNTNTLTVSRYATTIKGSDMIAIVGTKSTISLNVVDEEKYNVESGKVKYYVENLYIGTGSVSDGVSTLTYTIPSKFDGKTVKYYATYERNGLYESTSYSNFLTVTHQKTVYVSPNGKNTNLGDKTHPFKTIDYALDHISLFGTIKLYAGTYSVSGLKLNTSVNIIGSGKDKTFIDGKKSGVPVFNITKRNAVLSIKGLTIKNAVSNRQFSAGAIVTSGKLNINNVRFVNNTGKGAFSGGAIYTNGILNVTNTEFTNNIVTNVNSQGGAIRCYDNTTYITNCNFNSNKVTGTNSTGAAAIFADSSDIILNRTKFTNNVAKGKYVTGGVMKTISGVVVLDTCTFRYNKISSTDYGMGGLLGALSTGVSIINSTMEGNVINAKNSAGGSIIYIEGAAMDIKNSKLNYNNISATNTYGGAIYGYKASINMINNKFTANRLIKTDNGYGGAIYVYNGLLNITKNNFVKNTIKANKLALAGAIYSYSTVYIMNSNFEKNDINASNLGGGAIANMGVLNVTNTNFISNNAYKAGNAITATTSAKNTIENNYWGSSSPTWSSLLYSVKKPNKFSKTKIKN